MLKGFFTSMKTNTLSLGSYSSPNLNNFSGNITFFPKRSYPLRLYYLKVKDVSLKYNEAERSKTELLTPGLAVLQKKRGGGTQLNLIPPLFHLTSNRLHEL